MPGLTAKSVATPARPGLHSDGGCLYLSVLASGAKSGVVRLVVPTETGQKRRDLGIGSAAHVSLAEARAKAAEMEKAARDDGTDPDAPCRAAKAAQREAAARAG